MWGDELKFHLLKKCNLTIPNTYFLESAMGKWWLVNQLTWNLIVVKKKFVIYVPIPSQFSIFPVHDKLHKINENSYEQKVIPIGQKYRAPAQKKNPSIEFRVGLGHKSMLLWRVVR